MFMSLFRDSMTQPMPLGYLLFAQQGAPDASSEYGIAPIAGLFLCFGLVLFLLLMAAVIFLVMFLRRSTPPQQKAFDAPVRRCPECGTALAADAPHGLCPRCLLRSGMGETPTGLKPEPSTTPHHPRHEPEGAPSTGKDWAGQAAPAAALACHFPHLEILQLLGQGGMGAVYKARQPKLDRLVALKVLPGTAGQDTAFAERFTREARALARLDHTRIVRVHDFGITGEASAAATGVHYFIMEYVDGVNLREHIRDRRLEPAEALSIISQVCDALQYAHEEGVVHRDIKPENILLDRKGRVKIADFGLAKILDRRPADFTLTATHQVMGTPHYMAPEQIDKPLDVDHRADIYALGVVLYEMLTGELPMGSFVPPSQKAGVDPRLDVIVLKAMAREPERRYQAISEVKQAVEALGGVTAPQPVTVISVKPEPERIDLEMLRQRLEVPATLMFVVGLLVVLASVPLSLVCFWYAVNTAAGYAQPNYSPGYGQTQSIPYFVLSVIVLVAGTVVGGVAMYGAMKMRRLESYGFAVVAAILMVLSLYGSPLGIWALWRLTRPAMRAAFRAKTAGQSFVVLERRLHAPRPRPAIPAPAVVQGQRRSDPSAPSVPFTIPNERLSMAWGLAEVHGVLTLHADALTLDYQSVGMFRNSPLKSETVPLADIRAVHLKTGWFGKTTLQLTGTRLGALAGIPGNAQEEAELAIRARDLPAAMRVLAVLGQQAQVQTTASTSALRPGLVLCTLGIGFFLLALIPLTTLAPADDLAAGMPAFILLPLVGTVMLLLGTWKLASRPAGVEPRRPSALRLAGMLAGWTVAAVAIAALSWFAADRSVWPHIVHTTQRAEAGWRLDADDTDAAFESTAIELTGIGERCALGWERRPAPCQSLTLTSRPLGRDTSRSLIVDVRGLGYGEEASGKLSNQIGKIDKTVVLNWLGTKAQMMHIGGGAEFDARDALADAVWSIVNELNGQDWNGPQARRPKTLKDAVDAARLQAAKKPQPFPFAASQVTNDTTTEATVLFEVAAGVLVALVWLAGCVYIVRPGHAAISAAHALAPTSAPTGPVAGKLQALFQSVMSLMVGTRVAAPQPAPDSTLSEPTPKQEQ